MLSRSEASLVPEAEILRSACGLAQDDNRAAGSYSFMSPKSLSKNKRFLTGLYGSFLIVYSRSIRNPYSSFVDWPIVRKSISGMLSWMIAHACEPIMKEMAHGQIYR